MDYPGDLIKHAFGLCDRALASAELNQADLRRRFPQLTTPYSMRLRPMPP